MTEHAATVGTLQQTLLHAWETLHSADDVARPLGLLQAVWPQEDPGVWRQASLGQRDACLFLLQSSLFGDRLSTVAACPACGERLESHLQIRELCPTAPSPPGPRMPFDLHHCGYQVTYRLPCSDDLQWLGNAEVSTDSETTAAEMLRGCVLQAACDGRALAPSQLPPSVIDRLDEAMAQQDPLADVQLQVACPACNHHWSAGLDIARYLWDELDDWAQDLLAEVDVLARHYAWSERDILSLTPIRRQFYLDLVRA
ncbi:MAG TPA: hypothetical protein VM469_07170 [Pseudoxanthomonas sp.]|nr:hypothetical protein [Pseudoxanthomonas sp.]